MIAWSLLAQAGAFDQLGLYVLPLVGSVMLAFGIFHVVMELRGTDAKRMQERLRDRLGADSLDTAERRARDSILRQSREPTTAFGASIARLRLVSNLQRLLDQADIGWSAAGLLINLAGLSLAAYVACHFLKLDLWIRISFAVVVFIGPLVFIYVKRNMRLNRFMRQLPDVFELMGQALRAGHSLANAILLVSQQLPAPVSTEFARVFHEQNLGIKIEDALTSMARRVGLMDVRFFVTAVLIQRQTGGDLAEVLDNISGVIRERIKLFGTVKALTAEGRLSGWVLLALPVVVFLLELIINPNYADVLLNDPVGQYMLISAGVAQILGLAMIQKIVNIKV